MIIPFYDEEKYITFYKKSTALNINTQYLFGWTVKNCVLHYFVLKPILQKSRTISSFKIKTIWFYGLNPSIFKMLEPTAILLWVFRGEKLATTTVDIIEIAEALSPKKMCHGTERMVVGCRRVRTICWMWKESNCIEFSDLFHGSSVEWIPAFDWPKLGIFAYALPTIDQVGHTRGLR